MHSGRARDQHLHEVHQQPDGRLRREEGSPRRGALAKGFSFYFKFYFFINHKYSLKNVILFGSQKGGRVALNKNVTPNTPLNSCTVCVYNDHPQDPQKGGGFRGGCYSEGAPKNLVFKAGL